MFKYFSLCLFLVATTHAYPPNFHPERVINGTDTSRSNYPFIGSIQAASWGHWGGASLIQMNDTMSTWLTAAHVCYGWSQEEVQQFSIYAINQLDDVANAAPSRIFAVESMEIDSNFVWSDSVVQDDGCIVRCTGGAEETGQLETIQLCTSEAKVTGTMCQLIGWGSINGETYEYNVMQMAQVPVVDDGTCTQQYSQINYNVDTNSMFCAGYMNGGTDSCTGDDGGPLVAVEDGHPCLLGMVAGGNGCAQEGYPGIYTNVPYLYSTYKF